MILRERLDAIERLTLAADANPARRPEAIKARLAESVAALMEAGRGFDENRLHQEAILLAARADVREELDRLKTHVAAARATSTRAGRSAGASISSPRSSAARPTPSAPRRTTSRRPPRGLNLRAQIEQFREQAQNVE